MKSETKDLYILVRDTHAQVYNRVKELTEQTKALADLEEQADNCYALHQTLKLIEDMRGQLRDLKDMAERLTGVLWSKLSDGDPIRTTYVTATPRLRVVASIPSRKSSPEKYNALMNALGVPTHLSNKDTEVVRVHWPGLCDHLTSLQEQGLPLPEGLDGDKTWTQYSMLYRAKKGVDED